MNIISLMDARRDGLQWYFTGAPCKHGHVTKRRTNNSVCFGCEQSHRNFRPQGITVHGLTGTVEHNIWCGIRKRCNNKRSRIYKYYGGKGVKLCARWNDFANFLADMGPRPSPWHSVERNDSNGDYEPNNCRWATKVEQMRNTSYNRLLTLNGETHCVVVWAELRKISVNTIRKRVYSGYTDEQALHVGKHSTRWRT